MKIAVVVGTTRDGRITPKLARWVEKSLRSKHDDVSVLDLAEFDLPMLSEAPWLPDRELTDGAKRWLEGLEAADAYVFVTGEYYHGVPAVLKNALEYTSGHLKRKPVGIVTHGVVSGSRANEQLRLVFGSQIAAPVVPDSVTFYGKVDEAIDDDGNLAAGFEHNDKALNAHLDELIWYMNALGNAQ